MPNSRPAPSKSAAWYRAAYLIVPMALFIACFGRLLFTRETFVFRDSGHYYYPLWRWITAHWRRGEFPLWNPYENGGGSLAADATASLFYPGKLVFLLPLPFDVTYNVFLVGHVALAYWLAWHAARTFALKPAAATLAAMAYAFSGSVLIQHANAPFLIGAAWLPLAFSGGFLVLRERRWRGAIEFAIALALMLLGGDVQSAYHCLLMLLVGWWVVPCDRESSETSSVGWHRWRLTLVTGSCLLAIGLSAIQILPAREATPDTVRAAYDHPRNVFEAGEVLLGSTNRESPEAPLSEIKQGLFGVPAARSHHETSYQFSVGPWRWPELLWPNVSGQMFPVHRRWLGAIPAEGRVWSPSLYLGAIPFLLALSVIRFRKGKPAIRWLSLAGIAALLAALGWYGLGWVVHEIVHATSGNAEQEPWIGPQVGGLYWLYSTLLPGYAYFRYPAKWMTIASFALCMLAGYGFQLNARRMTRRLRGLLMGSAALSVIGGGLLWLFCEPWSNALLLTPADPFFGPLDIDGAWRDAMTALVQTALVASVAYCLFSRRNTPIARHAAVIVVAATALDLAVAQHWLTPTAPTQLWHEQPEVVRLIERDAMERPPRVFRSRSSNLLPPAWSDGSSDSRLVEGLIWERDTLHAKHYLTHGIGSIDVPTPMRTDRHAASMNLLSSREREAEATSDLTDLAVTHWIAPRELLESPELAAEFPLSDQPHAAVARIESSLPRAFLVRDGRRVDIPDDSSEHVTLILDTPNRLEFDVRLDSPATLVVCDSHDLNWQAELRSARGGGEVEIDRENELFRSVSIGAGEHRLSMAYRPWSVLAGAIVSGICWAFLIAYAIVRRRIVSRQHAADV